MDSRRKDISIPRDVAAQQRRGSLPSGDERSGVLRHLMRFVKRYRPEFVFIENVPGLRKHRIGLNFCLLDFVRSP